MTYLDHAAAAPLDPRVREAMEPFLTDAFANPSSFHMAGKRVRDAIENARQQVADLLGARSDEILFTSGGTESDNLAVLGIARASKAQGMHLVTSTFEHQAVMEPMLFLEKKEGYEVTRIGVDALGLLGPDEVERALRPDTTLVSLMYANNEIGTVLPIGEIGNMIQKTRLARTSAFPLFHTDACQAAGYLPMDISKLHADLLTLNGSKIYGPKGIGALYVRRGVKLQPLQFGGSQERSLRPGTEHVAGIIGFAKALEIAQAERASETTRLIALRDRLITGILKTIPKTRLNGDWQKRLPNNVNISFLDVEGEALILYLDAKGIFASTGSACTSASLDPSHVILALGVPYEVAHGSVRFSLGRSTTDEDIDKVLEVLPDLVANLRALSPVHVDEKYYERPGVASSQNIA